MHSARSVEPELSSVEALRFNLAEDEAEANPFDFEANFFDNLRVLRTIHVYSMTSRLASALSLCRSPELARRRRD